MIVELIGITGQNIINSNYIYSFKLKQEDYKLDIE